MTYKGGKQHKAVMSVLSRQRHNVQQTKGY